MKERSLGDILNDTFVIYGKGFKGFLLIAFIVFGPVNMLTLVSPRSSLQEYLTTGSISGSAVIFYIGAAIVTIVATTTVFCAISAGVGQLVAFGRIDIGACFLRVAWRIYSLLFVSFILTTVLVVGIGGAVLLIPAIASLAFLLFASMALPVSIYEGSKYMAALSRSFHLVKSSWKRVLGGVFLITMLMLGLALVLAVPSLIFAPSDSGGVQILPSAIQYIAGLISNAAAVTVAGIAVTLLYFDVRVRSEGFTLDKLISELGVRVPRQNNTNSLVG